MTVVFSCAMRQMTMPKTALATMSANFYRTSATPVAFYPPRPMPLSMYTNGYVNHEMAVM
jgi:hypothetical protein